MRFICSLISVGTLVAFVFTDEPLFKAGLIIITFIFLVSALILQLKRGKKMTDVINRIG